MGRSNETYSKKEVKKKKDKKRKDKVLKKQAKKDQVKSGNLEDMIAYVNEDGSITTTKPETYPGKK